MVSARPDHGVDAADAVSVGVASASGGFGGKVLKRMLGWFNRGWFNTHRVTNDMDPDPEQIALAAQTGADRIELYTEHYARAHEQGDFASTLKRYQKAAACARQHGLEVNAGHDLNLANLPDFRIEGLEEVSIGHAFTIDALRFGLQSAVERYLEALHAAAAS